MKTTIKYGRKSLSLEDVLVALRSRDLEIKKEKKSNLTEGLYVKEKYKKKSHFRGRSVTRSHSRSRGTSRTLAC